MKISSNKTDKRSLQFGLNVRAVGVPTIRALLDSKGCRDRNTASLEIFCPDGFYSHVG
jgi:hypothetical protein